MVSGAEVLRQRAGTFEERKPPYIYFSFDAVEVMKGSFVALISSILSYLWSEVSHHRLQCGLDVEMKVALRTRQESKHTEAFKQNTNLCVCRWYIF